MKFRSFAMLLWWQWALVVAGMAFVGLKAYAAGVPATDMVWILIGAFAVIYITLLRIRGAWSAIGHAAATIKPNSGSPLA